MKMTERNQETIIAMCVLGILLLTWLGFFLHRSPRFPGSGVGAIFGIAAAVLMLVPLGYTVAKRMTGLTSRIVSRVSMKTLMTLHVYAGLTGALFAIIHTGHRFDSWLGIALITVMLLLVVSGVAVRYLLTFVAREMKEKLALLQTARGDLDNAWGILEKSKAQAPATPQGGAWAAGMASIGLPRQPVGPAGDVIRIAEGVADLEYSVRLHEVFKSLFGWSLKLHIVVSILFYCLLALHIVAGVQYGLRWLS